MHITNTVATMFLGVTIDLNRAVRCLLNVIYSPRKFNGLRWRARGIGATCLLFASGKIVIAGLPAIRSTHTAARRYARILQKRGFPVKPQRFKVVTRSAVHTLSSTVSYSSIVNLLDGCHEPEIFHAISLKREKVHFTIYTSGKVIITGIKSKRELQDVIQPTIVELEMLSDG